MKVFRFALVAMAVGMAFTSCTVTRKTAVVTNDLDNRVYQTPVMVDMDVKARTEMTMTGKQLKYKADPKAFVIAMLLKQTDCDVLLEERSTIAVRHGLFGSKLRSITVTGFPAKYTNFRNATEKDMQLINLSKETVGHDKVGEPRSFLGL